MPKKIILVIILTMLIPIKVCGADEENNELTYYDFDEIEDECESSGFDFEETVKEFINGNVDESFNNLGKEIVNSLTGELIKQRKLVIEVIIIGIAAAVFTNIAASFLSGKTSDTGFYITFMALMSSLCAGYAITCTVVTKALNSLISLMNAIVPVYILSIGFSTGQASAAGFYEIISIVIVLIEKILLTVIIPMIYIYMIISLINNISEQNMLTKACELLKSVIEWVLKALMSFVIGINVIQGMISPIVDGIKTSAIGKAFSIIPGVGGALSSVSGIILGSGTLIKNSIGMASMIAVVTLCFAPVVKTIVMSIAYKAAGALLEPVSDKRITGAISGIYESMLLLTKTLLYAVVFFILTIAIICCTTNSNVT